MIRWAWLVSTRAVACAVHAQDAPDAERHGDVRQIVTFLFQPGRTSDAVTIYERQLRPIYAAVPALRRFRAYREVESPEPLDLVVVSHYDGMAGMDAANDALRAPGPDGASAFALYGTLSAMTQHHHDQFVEILPALSDTIDARETARLTVFEYVRVTPGAHARYESLVATALRPLERSQRLSLASETGRMLVSDGWDYLRLHRMRSLGDWQRHALAMQSFDDRLGPLVAARKVIILREDPRLSVR
jgi:hypothetical protein